MSDRIFWNLCGDETLQRIHDSYARLAVTHREQGHYGLAHYCRQQQVRTLVELSLRAQEAAEFDQRQIELEL